MDELYQASYNLRQSCLSSRVIFKVLDIFYLCVSYLMGLISDFTEEHYTKSIAREKVCVSTITGF
jgi:hypothetical protein